MSCQSAIDKLKAAIAEAEAAEIAKTRKLPIRIVIGHRGWVWVGRYDLQGDNLVLHNAKNIRLWGTKNGLGELCEGPTSQTVLDPAGMVRMHRLGEVASYDVNEAKWAAYVP